MEFLYNILIFPKPNEHIQWLIGSSDLPVKIEIVKMGC